MSSLCSYEIATRTSMLTAVELNFLVIRHLCSSGAPRNTQGTSFLLANYRKASFQWSSITLSPLKCNYDISDSLSERCSAGHRYKRRSRESAYMVVTEQDHLKFSPLRLLFEAPIQLFSSLKTRNALSAVPCSLIWMVSWLTSLWPYWL